MNTKDILKLLHSYDDMVAKRPNLSYPAASVKALMEAVEKPIMVFNVIQESNCDGEILVNVTPCADLETAKAVMAEEIDTLLSDGKYSGLDLDEIERDQNDEDADCDYTLERDETSFYLSCNYDDYSERIEIEEKEIVNRC
jgi:hypothetical protein